MQKSRSDPRLLLALLASLAAGQQPPTPQQPPFRADINLVRVDVYPTKNGQIVQGLQAGDFEVSEDGVLQKVATFEHVVVRGGSEREREINSQRDMLQAAANPRNRVFVIFLDKPHVGIQGSHAINEPIVTFLRQLLGPDDLVGLMTPDMSAANVVLARNADAIVDGVRRKWDWGIEREDGLLFELDERESQYVLCYPPRGGENPPDGVSALARQMIHRKRQRATLEALRDLVFYLHTIREERKAIVTVTQGWNLFREDHNLTKLREGDPVPGVDRIRVGPDGKLTNEDKRNSVNALPKTSCDADRMRLSEMNNERFLREIINDANRSNATFYMIDPRGLTVSATRRNDAMIDLANNTDGLATLNTNDLDASMRRIADDMSSYYLLGYYSTNDRRDGRYRSIKVRVKQPGIDVRARKGYRPVSQEEINAAALRTAAAAIEAGRSPVGSALAKLTRIRPEVRFRVNAAVAAGTSAETVWVAGELAPTGGKPDEYALGGTADVEVNADGKTTTARVTLKPGERTFATSLKLESAPNGPIEARVRLTPADGPAEALTDTVRIDRDPTAATALLFRRGATTGNRVLPAADVRFSRIERLRLEVPVSSDIKPGVGRILDRMGQPLPIPVPLTERTDDAGQRWILADITLSQLSAGDYVVELELGTEPAARSLTAIRISR
jgi:VWFA-related protein